MPSLKKKKDLQELRELGKFVHVSHWLAVSFRANDSSDLRWAWTVPKKVGTAVTRNRLKRWGREEIKSFKSYGIDINFIFKAKGTQFYRDLSREEFDRVMSRAFAKIS